MIHLCTSICNAVQNSLVCCCNGLYAGQVCDSAVKDSDVINLGRFDSKSISGVLGKVNQVVGEGG